MKTLNKLFLVAVLLMSLIACEKEEDPSTQAQSFPNPTPTFSDADGVLAAIQVISYQSAPIVGEIAIYADVASAFFFDGSNNFHDAGIVSVNTNDLQSLDNNSYVLPGVGSTSIDFDFSSSNGNAWTVAGGASVPAFNYTTFEEMPGDVKFNGDYTSISASAGVTVQIENAPTNTDSILYVIAYEGNAVTKTVGPNTTSVTFTASDLSGASGSGVVQVAAYNYEFDVVNGKKFYFINESLVTQVSNIN